MTGSRALAARGGAGRLLLLLRHGEAESLAPTPADRDRALTRRGLLEAERAARCCADHRWQPQRVLTSPARRATATASVIARELGLQPGLVEVRDALYLADVETLLAEIAAVDPRVRSLMVVGHNPGLSALATTLAPEYHLPALDTGTVCALRMEAHEWSELAHASALDAQYAAPRP